MDDFLAPHNGVARAIDHPRKRSTLSRMVARGTLLWAFPGVLMHKSLEDEPEAWVRAALLWQPDAMVGGRLAANWGTDLAMDVKDVLLHVHTRRQSSARVSFLAPDVPDHLVNWRGHVPYTSPEATCLIAGLIGDFDAATAILRSRGATAASLLRAARSWPGRRHPARLAVARDLSRNPWSVAELQAHRLLRSHGASGWVGNHEVAVDGRRHFIDVALPEMKIGFEVNSFQFHSSRSEMERDSAKMNSLTRAGWDMYVVTPRQITDAPDETGAFMLSVMNKRHRRGRRT